MYRLIIILVVTVAASIYILTNLLLFIELLELSRNQQKKYGPIYRAWIGHIGSVEISKAEYVEVNIHMVVALNIAII